MVCSAPKLKLTKTKHTYKLTSNRLQSKYAFLYGNKTTNRITR